MKVPVNTLLVCSGVVALAAAAVAAWPSGGGRAVYTDAGRIRVPSEGAPVRQVLWLPAEPVAGGVNTSAEEYEPRLSPDGATMVLVRGRPGENADLFSSRWTPDGWTEPTPVESINTPADELGPEISRDGRSLYFYSDRPGGEGGYDIWVARAEGDAWSAPVNAGPAINTRFNEYGPAISPDGGTLYFASNRPRPGEGEPQDDSWRATVRERRDRHDYDLYSAGLGAEGFAGAAPVAALNTSSDEGAPAISPAGDFLYFASDRPGGRGGYDLYRSRLLRGGFTPVENLGEAVNGSANELDPALSWDGFRLHFSSDRPDARGEAPAGRAPGDYSLWVTTSREVFLEQDASRASSSLWNLWNNLWPWLLLLLLLLLLRAWRDPAWRDRYRSLGLFARCLLLSLLLHALLASLLAMWQVTTQLSDYLRRSGGTRVILASTGASDVALQIGSLVTAATVRPPEVELSPAPSRLPDLSAAPAAVEPAARAPIADEARLETAAAEASPPESTPEIMQAAMAAPAPTVVPTVEAPRAVAETAAGVATPAPAPARALPRGLIESQRTDVNPSARAPGPAVASLPIAPADSRSGVSAPLLSDASAPAMPATVTLPDARATVPAVAERAAVASARVPAPARARPGGGSISVERVAVNPAPATRAPESSMSIPQVQPATGPAVADVGISATTDVALPGPVLTSLPSDAPVPGRARPERTVEVGAATPRIARAVPRAAPGPGVPDIVRVAPGPRHAAEAGAPIELSGVAASEAQHDAVAPRPIVAPGVPSRVAVSLPPTPLEPIETFAQRAPEMRREVLQEMGGSLETERAVGLALEWFARHQHADGRWSGGHFDDGCAGCGGEAEIDADAAMTGISLLCFLGAGHTHTTEGPYRDVVRRGLEWLVSRQGPDGDLRRGETMYGQTVAAVALCEAFAMTRDRSLAEPTRRAIDFIIRGRRDARNRSDDTSVLGWQVMVMESARRAGIDVPGTTFDQARRWLDTVAAPGSPGRYAHRAGEAPSPAMTAEAMFVQQLLGRSRAEPRMEDSARFILGTPPRWKDGAPTYYWYYATLALFHHQGDAWNTWNEALVPELLANQRTGGPAAGSWDPQDRWSRLGGRIYQTAVCTLSLEVYYRYRPEGAP